MSWLPGPETKMYLERERKEESVGVKMLEETVLYYRDLPPGCDTRCTWGSEQQ